MRTFTKSTSNLDRLLLLLVAAVLAIATASSCEAALKENLDPKADLRIGVMQKPEKCDEKSAPGDRLVMHYSGFLVDGTKFDSSRDRNQPFDFVLGAGQVIKGWDRGLTGMCPGERRKLTIPSDLGYGSRGSPPKIPGGATLIFDVELIKIDKKQGKEGL